jgi:arginase
MQRKDYPVFFAIPSHHIEKPTPEGGVPTYRGMRIGDGESPLYADIGAALGPQRVLYDNEFLSRYPERDIQHFTQLIDGRAPLVSHGDMIEHVGTVYGEIAKSMMHKLKRIWFDTNYNPIPIVLGGDHSVASPGLETILLANNRRRMGVLMVDSHGDIHHKTTSPSGSYHGMWLRPHLQGSNVGFSSITGYIQCKVHPSHLMYVGNLDLESEEKRFIRENGVQVVTLAEFRRDREAALKRVYRFMDSLDFTHVSLDIDAFQRRFAPGTGLPAKRGLHPDDVLPIMHHAQRSCERSLDVVEVYPQKDRNGATVKLAQQMISAFIG